MEREKITAQCLKCGDYRVNGVWYVARNAPKHDIRYTHAICPWCQKEKDGASEKA